MEIIFESDTDEKGDVYHPVSLNTSQVIDNFNKAFMSICTLYLYSV